MSFSVIVLLARIGLVVLLYLFLLWAVRGMLRDLRSVAGSAAPSASKQATTPGVPLLVVLAVGQTPYHVGQQFRLHSPMMLGRDPANDIAVEDDFVSAQHLRVQYSGSSWLAQDLNSTNGTRINGTRLRGSAALKQGDVLDVGRLRLRFTMDR